MKFPSIKSPDIDLTIKNPKEIIGDVKQWRLNRKLKDELKSKKAILPLVYFENEEIFLYFDAFIRLCSAFVATNKALDSQPNNGGIKKALQDKNQQLLYCFQNHVTAYNIKNKFHIYKFEKQESNKINYNDIYTKNQFEKNKLKNIESLANDYDNLEYFKQSLANYFESNFIKYAQSNNYYDKFRYYRIFTNKEIFDTFIVTFIDLALAGISAAIPGITPAAVTGRFIFASLSGGSKVASPLLQRAYFTFRSEKYDGLNFEIPSEFIEIYDNNTNKILNELQKKYNKNSENLIEQNKIISQNRIRNEKEIKSNKSKFKETNFNNINQKYKNIKNEYDSFKRYFSELNSLNKISVSLEKMTRQASKNGLVNYNLSILFHYYKELIEKNEKLSKKTGFDYIAIQKDNKLRDLYKKDLDEIKHLYFKTLNYSRYLKALKTPLSLQIGSARLGLLKSIDFLFKSDSALFQFVKNNIKIDDKSIYQYIEVIKDTLNKKYKKKLSDEEVNFYSSLIFKFLISSYSSKKDTDTFNKKLESQLNSDFNIKKFGNDASKWMKKINSNSLFSDRNYGYTKNLFTGNDFDNDLILNSVNNSSKNELMSIKGTSQTSYVTLGGTLIYDVVLGLCYFQSDGIPSAKKENFNEWLKVLFGISFMAQNAMGFANGISVCSTGVALDQLSSHLNGISTSLNSSLINRLFPPDPISIFVQDIGYLAVTNIIGHAEKKMWQSIIKNYYEYREYDKNLRERVENFERDSTKEKKLYRNHHRISKTGFLSSFFMNFSTPGSGILHPEILQYAKYKLIPDIKMDNQILKPDRKIWRPAYDYSKKQDKGATEYMRNISKSYSDALCSTMKTTISVNSDIIKLIDLIIRVENQTNKITTDDINSFKTFNSYLHEHGKNATADDVIRSFTKLIMKILGVSTQIESYNRYLDDFVEALINEVDDTLKIYLGYTIEDLNDVSNYDVLKNLAQFGEMEEISKSVLNQDLNRF